MISRLLVLSNLYLDHGQIQTGLLDNTNLSVQLELICVSSQPMCMCICMHVYVCIRGAKLLLLYKNYCENTSALWLHICEGSLHKRRKYSITATGCIRYDKKSSI